MVTRKQSHSEAGFTWFDGAILLAALALAAAAVVVGPHFLFRPVARVRSAPSACIANLKQIDGAKATWALEEKKQPGDSPTDADLFGASRYIRDKPVCPDGGTYTLGKVSEKPRCSVSAHTL